MSRTWEEACSKCEAGYRGLMTRWPDSITELECSLPLSMIRLLTGLRLRGNASACHRWSRNEVITRSDILKLQWPSVADDDYNTIDEELRLVERLRYDDSALQALTMQAWCSVDLKSVCLRLCLFYMTWEKPLAHQWPIREKWLCLVMTQEWEATAVFVILMWRLTGSSLWYPAITSQAVPLNAARDCLQWEYSSAGLSSCLLTGGLTTDSLPVPLQKPKATNPLPDWKWLIHSSQADQWLRPYLGACLIQSCLVTFSLMQSQWQWADHAIIIELAYIENGFYSKAWLCERKYS